MWNGFPIDHSKPLTPSRYQQIRWPGSFAAWPSRRTEDYSGISSIGRPGAVRAFRDEDIQFLAPLLVERLTRAASDQQVGVSRHATGDV